MKPFVEVWRDHLNDIKEVNRLYEEVAHKAEADLAASRKWSQRWKKATRWYMHRFNGAAQLEECNYEKCQAAEKRIGELEGALKAIKEKLDEKPILFTDNGMYDRTNTRIIIQRANDIENYVEQALEGSKGDE